MHLDPLYGSFELPDYLEELIATPQFQRLKNISQAQSAAELCPKKVPSRFEHSIGVAHLMTLVAENNPDLESSLPLLQVAALLHDTGNPPFSHVSEPYLFELFKLNGESFLTEMIEGTAAHKILETLGIRLEDVTAIVTGVHPLAAVIHGSVDVDNIDNVRRYYHAYHPEIETFDGEELARSYRYQSGSWRLTPSAASLAQSWQKLRAEVYNIIESDVQSAGFHMTRRALYFGFIRNLFDKDFFKLSDIEAVRLLESKSPEAHSLFKKLRNQTPYVRVHTFSNWEGASDHPACTGNTLYNQTIASDIADELEIPEHAILVTVGKARNYRPLNIGWTDPAFVYPDLHHGRVHYRAIAFIDQEYLSKSSSVARLLAIHLGPSVLDSFVKLGTDAA